MSLDSEELTWNGSVMAIEMLWSDGIQALCLDSGYAGLGEEQLGRLDALARLRQG